jgi:hypothetical protein
MKFTLLLLLFAFQAKAQISEPVKYEAKTVGKIAPMGAFVADISQTGDSYTLSFNDMQYSKIDAIKSVSFQGKETLDKLYELFKSVFKPENKSNKDYLIGFKLGDKDVTISTYKNMGVTQSRFEMSGQWFSITERQVDKLFSK